MRDPVILFIHLITTIAKLMGPGGARATVAESLLVKHQLVILNRGRERAPNLSPMDRVIAGLCTLFVCPGRLLRAGIVLKPSTLLAFHVMLVKRKYRQLFSPKERGKPGPKGPSPELIEAIIEMKRHNPSWGCRRIAQQLSMGFGIEIDKDVVRRVLAKHFRPDPNARGPSWLTFLGHSKDACGVLICFAASHGYSKVTGFSLSWISSLAGSLALVFTQELSTVRRSVGCLAKRSVAQDYRNTSAQIMIRCSDSIAGRLIFEYSRSRKSRPCLTCQYRILLWND